MVETNLFPCDFEKKKYFKVKQFTLLICIILLIASSCKTFDHQNPYPNMKTVNYGSSHAYLFEAQNSEKLIICLEGSGWDSVLGVKGEKRWNTTRIGSQLLQALGRDYNLLIPEKLNRLPGKMYYNDMNDRAAYTADALLEGYVECINGYLAENNIKSIFLVGISEGAALLPKVYDRMTEKSLIHSFVSYGYGGLSLYESYERLLKSDVATADWKKMYSNVLMTFSKNNDILSSYKEDYWGLTYRWYNSFLFLRPIDYYRNIDIPVLFLHGKNDKKVSVESTKYIQKELPEKEYEFIYYGWGHSPDSYFNILKLRNDIADWINAF